MVGEIKAKQIIEFPNMRWSLVGEEDIIGRTVYVDEVLSSAYFYEESGEIAFASATIVDRLGNIIHYKSVIDGPYKIRHFS